MVRRALRCTEKLAIIVGVASISFHFVSCFTYTLLLQVTITNYNKALIAQKLMAEMACFVPYYCQAPLCEAKSCIVVSLHLYYIYITCVSAVSVVSSQTTSHVVLVQPRGDRHVKNMMRELKWSRGHGSTGPTRSRSTCEKDCARAKTETRTTLRLLPETLQTTALPSSQLDLIPST